MSGDRTSGEINYTNGDGEEREIHIVNGDAHVHYDTDKARSGEISWDSTGHHEPDEQDEYVMKITELYEKGQLEDIEYEDDEDYNNRKDWWKEDSED